MSLTIKAARIASGKTQVEVAAEAGMTERGYQNFEAKQDYKVVRTAILIAKALNKDTGEMDTLFGETQNTPGGNPANE